MQIVIVAGGGGSRLWPLSTSEKPKQFIQIIKGKSLIKYTFDILLKKFDVSQIWISTNENFRHLVLEQIPNFDINKLILEPEKRDSFAAECSALAVIASKTSADEVITFVPCDDYWPNIRSENNYLNALYKLENIALSCDIALLGIKPTYASTQYGYIELKNSHWAKSIDNPTKVKLFKEKPSKKIAEEYLEKGSFLWHTHSPTLTFNSLRKILKTTDTNSLKIFETFYKAKKINNLQFVLLPKESIDTKILEKANNRVVIGVDADWQDIGTWDVVEKYFTKPDEINHIQVDSINNKFYSLSNKKVAFVGVSNLLVVENGENLIIMDTRDIENIKDVVKKFT